MDMKALLIQSYDGSQFDTVFTGRRCLDTNGTNGQPLKDDYGRYQHPDCRDTNADFFHLAMTNLVGIAKRSVVVDITADIQVWNQPVRSFEILKYQPISQQDAMMQIHPLITKADTFFPADAASFVAVTTSMHYITEASGPQPLVKSGQVDQFSVTKTYDYILSLDAAGNINGGEWTGSSKVDHVDFLWLPTGRPADDSDVAGIKFGNVKQLLATSNACANN